jgi:pyruvate/2-oxoglutarate dehydrogenase complex dihydrolipoamide dehydrogenase (E3) component
VEFATISHALGAQVTILDRDTRLLNIMDAEISGYMENLFKE